MVAPLRSHVLSDVAQFPGKGRTVFAEQAAPGIRYTSAPP
jgi:hypothetical protein